MRPVLAGALAAAALAATPAPAQAPTTFEVAVSGTTGRPSAGHRYRFPLPPPDWTQVEGSAQRVAFTTQASAECRVEVRFQAVLLPIRLRGIRRLTGPVARRGLRAGIRGYLRAVGGRRVNRVSTRLRYVDRRDRLIRRLPAERVRFTRRVAGRDNPLGGAVTASLLDRRPTRAGKFRFVLVWVEVRTDRDAPQCNDVALQRADGVVRGTFPHAVLRKTRR